MSKNTRRAQWMPIEYADIEAMDNERQLNPRRASRLEALCWAWVKAQRGAPLTRRQLAAWAGFSGRQAGQILAEVKARRAAWQEEHSPKRSRIGPPAEPEMIHPHRTIPDTYEAKRSRIGPGSDQDRSDRGRGSTGTGTGTGTDQPDGRDRDRSDRAREHEQTRTARRQDLDLDYQDHGEHITTAEADSFLELLSARTPSI